MTGKVLVTGAAKRGGAAIARHVHARGYDVIIHCRKSSLLAAQALAAELNNIRGDSACYWAAELDEFISPPPMLDSIVGIVASASTYSPSTLENVSQRLEQDLQTHLKGHLALISHCRHALIGNNGSVVVITDVHVENPHKGYLSYQIAKGALATAVRALSLELAPHVRVNSVAPGTLDWPATVFVPIERKQRILETTPLARTGSFEELAKAVGFLLFDATFTTGATLNVDGGRSIYLE